MTPVDTLEIGFVVQGESMVFIQTTGVSMVSNTIKILDVSVYCHSESCAGTLFSG